jgi:uncharacterized protein (TIGR02246 family)
MMQAIFRSFLKVLVSFCFLALLSGCGDPTINVSPDRDADEAAIRALLSATEAAANSGGSVDVTALYTSEGDVWIAGLSRQSTHEGVRENEEQFQGIPGFQKWHVSNRSIRFISPDAAIVESSAVTTLDSGKFDEEATVVVTRTDAGWKIAAARVMNFDQTLLNLMTSDVRTSDQQRIKDVLNGIVAAAQTGDLDAYLSFVTEDAVMMWGGQPEVIGHKAVHEFMSQFSSGTQFDVQWETDEIEIFGNRAYHRYSGIAVMTPNDGGDVVRLDRKYFDLLRKEEDGTWRLSHHIYNLNVPYSQD